MHRVVLASLLACSSPPATQPTARPVSPPPPRAPSPELSPALAPLDWWRGDWAERGGSVEHWIAAGGALYGVALLPGGTFEVMIVDDAAGPGPADGTLRLYAIPFGAKLIEFTEQARQRRGAVFANPDHDHPKTIGYTLDDDGVLHAELTGDAPTERFTYAPATTRRATVLEHADEQFSDDVGKRGIDAWIDAFEPTGWMLREGERVEGAALRDHMGPVLAGGTLAWAPIASGMSGELGYTVGTATFTAPKPEASWRSSYVTIWARQPGGGWKVRFDIGRPINEPAAAPAAPSPAVAPAAPPATP